MSSIGSILNTARNALSAHQTAILVTSNNIANADVVGYSRQIARLEPAPVTREGVGQVGSGVHAIDIGRARDSLLDVAYRTNTAGSAEHSTRESLLDQVQRVLGDLQNDPIGSSFDAFWNSWSDLANQPGSTPNKSFVRQAGAEIVANLHDANARLDDIQSSIETQIVSAVDQLNNLTTTVAELNSSIIAAESGGQSAPQLRDDRDRALDALSKLADAKVSLRHDGSVGVTINGITVVDGPNAKQLALNTGTPATLGIVGSTDVISTPGATIGGMLTVLGVHVPWMRARLDATAQAVVEQTNQLHNTGVALKSDGTLATNIDFFDQSAGIAAVTAANISLSAAVLADPEVIAAGTDPAGGTGDNSLALKIAGLRTQAVSVITDRGLPTAKVTVASIADYQGETMSTMGQFVQSASRSASVFSTLATQADAMRQSVSGVSTDEELTLLIRQQQAYAAAARLVSVADEMAKAILAMT